MHSASALFFCLYVPLLAAVAGKEQYLPVMRKLGKIVKRIPHAHIVKVDEHVIEHDRARLFPTEEHIAQCKPQRQIQLIGRSPAEERTLMEHRLPGAADKGVQLAVERKLGIGSAGQPGERRGGTSCQRRGKLRAHLFIGERQFVERDSQRFQLGFHTVMLRFQRMETALPYQRIAERIEPSAQPGGFLTEKLFFFFVFRHLPERFGVAAEYLRKLLMKPQLLFGKAAGILALFFRRMSESLGFFPLRDIRREAFRNVLRCFGPVPAQYLTERPAGVGALA